MRRAARRAVGAPGVAPGGAAALPHGPARTAAEGLLAAGPPAPDRRTGGAGQLPPRHTRRLAGLAPGPPARVHPALTPGVDAAPDDGVAPGRGVPDLDESGDGGEGDEDEQDPEDGHEDDGAQEAHAEEEHPLAALHEAALGREAERLRLGPLVGDQGGHRQDGHGQQREVAVPAAEQVPRAAEHEDGIGDPVGDRVEEGAPDRRRARRLGDGAVEEVVHARDDEEDDGEVEVAGRHQDRRGSRRDQAGGGEHVCGDAMAVECLADRTGGPVDGGSPTAVEHEAPRRARARGGTRPCLQEFTIRSPKPGGSPAGGVGASPGPRDPAPLVTVPARFPLRRPGRTWSVPVGAEASGSLASRDRHAGRACAHVR